MNTIFTKTNDFVRLTNRKYAESEQKYREKNREIIRKKDLIYKAKNKAKLLKYNRNWKKQNKEHTAKYIRERRRTDNLFRLKHNISSNLRVRLSAKGYVKDKPFSKYFNYSILDLKLQLEKTFIKDMSWDNYGSYWHVDHKIPIAWFKTKTQIINKGFRLKNLQALPAKLNMSKNSCYCSDVEKNPISCEVFILV